MFLNTLSLFIRASCVVDVYLEVILWTSLPIMPGLYNKCTHTPRHEQTPTPPTHHHTGPPKPPAKRRWAQNTGTVYF